MNPSPDDHEVLRERLGAYVLGGLEGFERHEVDDHLVDCASCRAELNAIAPLAGPLGRIDPDRLGDAGGPATAAGPGSLVGIAGRVHDEKELDATPATGLTSETSSSSVVPLRRRASRTSMLIAAAGLVIALAGLGAGFGLGLEAAEGPLEPVAVQTVAAGVQADAARIDHSWGVEVVLTARGFEPGRAYQVAVVDRSGRPVGAGAFVGTGSTEMECRLNSSVPPGEATGFVVTTAPGVEVLRSRFA